MYMICMCEYIVLSCRCGTQMPFVSYFLYFVCDLLSICCYFATIIAYYTEKFVFRLLWPFSGLIYQFSLVGISVHFKLVQAALHIYL